MGPEKSDEPPLSPAVSAALEKGLTKIFGVMNFVFASWKEAEKEAFLEKWNNWSPEERGRFVIAKTYGFGISGLFKGINPFFQLKIIFLTFYLFINSLRYKVKQIPVHCGIWFRNDEYVYASSPIGSIVYGYWDGRSTHQNCIDFHHSIYPVLLLCVH
jgi:hypothetical protein